jgi:hypothetical protein
MRTNKKSETKHETTQQSKQQTAQRQQHKPQNKTTNVNTRGDADPIRNLQSAHCALGSAFPNKFANEQVDSLYSIPHCYCDICDTSLLLVDICSYIYIDM